MAFHNRYRLGMPAVVDVPGGVSMPTARQVAAGDPVTKAVASKRHFAVLQEVARACELSDVQHVVEPSAVLEDPNGTGVKIELDMLMRDSAGMLLGIDATVGTWDKENVRQCVVRGKGLE